MKSKYRKFLIVRTDRIGDVLLTLPMARALKEWKPTAHVAMLIREYTREIVSSDPFVDEVITLGDDGGAFRHTLRQVRASGFDVVFHTHPRLQLALLTILAGIPLRVGTGYRWYSFLFNKRRFEHRKDARRHELEYNLNLLQSVGCHPPAVLRPEIRLEPEHRQAATRVLERLAIPPDVKLVILHPGSGGSARDWNWRNFGRLAGLLASRGGITVLLTGGRGEEEIVERVRSVCGGAVRVLVDAIGILEYAALTEKASLFIANSTGPLHIAAAVGTPVIGFYPSIRPLSAERWGPYTDRKVLFSPRDTPADCTKCLAPGVTDCECMDTITVEEVFRSASEMLGPGKDAG